MSKRLLSEKGSTGLLCGLCIEGYAYSTSARRCDECESDGKMAAQIILTVMLVLVLLCVIANWFGRFDTFLSPDSKIRRRLHYFNMGTVSKPYLLVKLCIMLTSVETLNFSISRL